MRKFKIVAFIIIVFSMNKIGFCQNIIPDSLYLSNNYHTIDIKSIDFSLQNFDGYLIIEITDLNNYDNSNLYLPIFYINKLKDINNDESKLWYIEPMSMHVGAMVYNNQNIASDLKNFADFYFDFNKSNIEKCSSYLFQFAEGVFSNDLSSKEIYILNDKKYLIFNIKFDGYYFVFDATKKGDSDLRPYKSILPISYLKKFEYINAIDAVNSGFEKTDMKILVSDD